MRSSLHVWEEEEVVVRCLPDRLDLCLHFNDVGVVATDPPKQITPIFLTTCFRAGTFLLFFTRDVVLYLLAIKKLVTSAYVLDVHHKKLT